MKTELDELRARFYPETLERTAMPGPGSKKPTPHVTFRNEFFQLKTTDEPIL